MRGSPGCHAGGLPGRRAARGGVRRGAHRGRADGRRARVAGLPLRRAGHPARAPRARRPAPGRPARAGGAHRERRAGARLRARRARTPRRVRCWPPRGRRWWPSTWTWTPTTSSWRGRSPRTPRVGAGRPGGGARDRPAAGRARPGPGVHQRPRPPRRRRCAAIVEAVRARAPVAEAELVGLAPRGGLRGLPLRRAAEGLRSRAAPDRERVTLSFADGADQEEALPQAPRHARRDHRAPGTRRAAAAKAKAQGRPQAGRAGAPGRAPGPPAHLARRGEPRGHRRRGLRAAGGGRVRPRAGPGRCPGRCSCSCSTSRSAT